jgi:hypothetical protein
VYIIHSKNKPEFFMSSNTQSSKAQFLTTAALDAVSREAHRGFRLIAGISLATAFFLNGTSAAVAQTAPDQQSAKTQSAVEHRPRWDFLVASGSLIPTGTQRDEVKRANLTAAQFLYVIRPERAFTATLGWARSQDATEHKLDAFSYDLGVEARPDQWALGNSFSLSPFVGVGGDLGIHRVHIRLEVRDYLSGASSQRASGTRNDVIAMLGLYISGQ